MKSINFLYLVLPIYFLVGCSSTVESTNRSSVIPTPKISSTDSVANIEVGGLIRGQGCANEFLMLFKSGDNKFLSTFGSVSSSVERAKAAAAYKALDDGKGLSTDIIVHPIWEITREKVLFGVISDDTCAKVVGYRGVIKSIERTDSVTKPSQEENRAGSAGFLGLFK
jgi:hypothetical protein